MNLFSLTGIDYNVASNKLQNEKCIQYYSISIYERLTNKYMMYIIYSSTGDLITQ